MESWLLPVSTYHHTKIERSVSINFRDTKGAISVMSGLLTPQTPLSGQIFTRGPSTYRVAQIKIPHRTECNFSTTVLDFYTQIS